MPHQPRGFWTAIGIAILYPSTFLLARREARGAGNLPKTGGVLLVANHVSHLDGPMDAVFVRRNRRTPQFLVKAGLFRVFFVGTVLRGIGQVPVYRGTAKAGDSMGEAVAALNAGGTVVIYPEGTITKDPDGWPMSGRTGIARIALATDVPVIPVARWGTREILDHYRKTFRPFPRKTVTFLVGEPLDLSSYRGKPVTPQILREVTDLAMTEVRCLLADLREEPAPQDFYRV
ncbi:MAG: 1-acyl-sn-glycerol-3-phosphate acyltransferase [Actinomycetota bacterium]|nr:1-acyl-sn-glycerol-3-phosphate acyltransferase [Actinomycetota bacterium]